MTRSTVTSEVEIGPLSLAQTAMFDALSKIEYRRIRHREDFEAVGDLRQRAYDARDIYHNKFGAPVLEDVDFEPDTYLFGIYYDDQIVATVRVNHLNAQNRMSPAVKLFGSTLLPLVDQGMSFIDPSRLAVDRAFSEILPGLPMFILRPALIAMGFFDASQCLCVCKEEHGAFYRRVFKATQIGQAKHFDDVKFPVAILGVSENNWLYTFRRNPIFLFTQTEERLLFEKSAIGEAPLSVRPTAAIAAGIAPAKREIAA